MTAAHTVQFFDSAESVGSDVGAFLLEGIRRGDHLMLVARPRHVQAIAQVLDAAGFQLSELVNSGRLTTLDAALTLRRLLVNGRPTPERFERVVAAPLREMVAAGHAVRVYGEMVDLLASDDNVRASAELETLWSGLIAATPVRLFCGYTAATFAVGRSAKALHSICACHQQVIRNESDLLANWLLTRSAAS